jgi:hypothetical protein
VHVTRPVVTKTLLTSDLPNKYTQNKQAQRAEAAQQAQALGTSEAFRGLAIVQAHTETELLQQEDGLLQEDEVEVDDIVQPVELTPTPDEDHGQTASAEDELDPR